jgi:leishmanolysin-like peptidase
VCFNTTAGDGVAADYILYVMATSTSSCEVNNQYNQKLLAYAGKCHTDQFDRPIAGRTNFCPSALSSADADYHEQFATAVHEIGHALGFASDSLAYFRDGDTGAPLTPRDEDGEPVPTPGNFRCPSGEIVTDAVLPANNTLQFFEERGLIVSKLVTPRLLSVARNFFDCPSLNGVEWENQPTSSGSCIGSHWEERLFEQELMTALSQERTMYSAMTLAFFEDTGWYKANFSKAGEHDGWGYRQGCPFATETCISTNVSSGEVTGVGHPFCTAEAEQGCSADYFGRGVCGVVTYTMAEVPAPYQYVVANHTVVCQSHSMTSARTFKRTPTVTAGTWRMSSRVISSEARTAHTADACTLLSTTRSMSRLTARSQGVTPHPVRAVRY